MRQHMHCVLLYAMRIGYAVNKKRRRQAKREILESMCKGTTFEHAVGSVGISLITAKTWMREDEMFESAVSDVERVWDPKPPIEEVRACLDAGCERIARGEATRSDIAREVGVSVHAVTRHLSSLGIDARIVSRKLREPLFRRLYAGEITFTKAASLAGVTKQAVNRQFHRRKEEALARGEWSDISESPQSNRDSIMERVANGALHEEDAAELLGVTQRTIQYHAANREIDLAEVKMRRRAPLFEQVRDGVLTMDEVAQVERKSVNQMRYAYRKWLRKQAG